MKQAGSNAIEATSAPRRRTSRALLRIAVTALVGGFICSMMVRFSPGFGMDENALDSRMSAASRQALEHAHDSERNIVPFYFSYVAHALKGDMGTSQSLGQPIASLIAERAPVTARLMIWGLGTAWVLAFVLAVPPILGRMPALGSLFTVAAQFPSAIPAAGIAIVLFRIGGPAQFTIALILLPKLYYYVRNLLRQSYARPHVLLARAKGLGLRRIVTHHVLPTACPELVALAAVSVNMAFGAVIAVEAICDLPGLGQLAWKAAQARDLPLLVILTLIVTLLTQCSNLMADLFTPERSRA